MLCHPLVINLSVLIIADRSTIPWMKRAEGQSYLRFQGSTPWCPCLRARISMAQQRCSRKAVLAAPTLARFVLLRTPAFARWAEVCPLLHQSARTPGSAKPQPPRGGQRICNPCPLDSTLEARVTTHTVYALVDPRDETVRYIGCTTRLLKRRVQLHWNEHGDTDKHV